METGRSKAKRWRQEDIRQRDGGRKKLGRGMEIGRNKVEGWRQEEIRQRGGDRKK